MDMSAAAGSLVSGGLNLLGGWLSNNASNKQATRQMAFQERMARNAHTYEVEDLRNAGLNPILSAKYGGAATPPGASAPQADIISGAVNSAQSARRLHADLKNLEETNENLKAQNKNMESSTQLNKANELKAGADAALSISSARNVEAQNSIIKHSIPGAQNEALYQEDVGKAAPWLRNSIQAVKDVLGVASSAKDLVTPTKKFIPRR